MTPKKEVHWDFILHQWVMNTCLLYSHTTQVWRIVVGGHDSSRLLKCPQERPILGKFLSYETLSQAVPLKETFQRHSAQLTFDCHPFSHLFRNQKTKIDIFLRRVSWFWRTSGSTSDKREIGSRSVAARKISGPHGLRVRPAVLSFFRAEKWEWKTAAVSVPEKVPEIFPAFNF